MNNRTVMTNSVITVYLYSQVSARLRATYWRDPYGLILILRQNNTFSIASLIADAAQIRKFGSSLTSAEKRKKKSDQFL